LAHPEASTGWHFDGLTKQLLERMLDRIDKLCAERDQLKKERRAMGIADPASSCRGFSFWRLLR
jgi:hypothetical protein